MYKPADSNKMLWPVFKNKTDERKVRISTYAAIIGMSPRIVQLKIKAGNNLEGVECVETVAGYIVITLKPEFAAQWKSGNIDKGSFDKRRK